MVKKTEIKKTKIDNVNLAKLQVEAILKEMKKPKKPLITARKPNKKMKDLKVEQFLPKIRPITALDEKVNSIRIKNALDSEYQKYLSESKDKYKKGLEKLVTESTETKIRKNFENQQRLQNKAPSEMEKLLQYFESNESVEQLLKRQPEFINATPAERKKFLELAKSKKGDIAEQKKNVLKFVNAPEQQKKATIELLKSTVPMKAQAQEIKEQKKSKREKRYEKEREILESTETGFEAYPTVTPYNYGLIGLENMYNQGQQANQNARESDYQRYEELRNIEPHVSQTNLGNVNRYNNASLNNKYAPLDLEADRFVNSLTTPSTEFFTPQSSRQSKTSSVLKATPQESSPSTTFLAGKSIKNTPKATPVDIPDLNSMNSIELKDYAKKNDITIPKRRGNYSNEALRTFIKDSKSANISENPISEKPISRAENLEILQEKLRVLKSNKKK